MNTREEQMRAERRTRAGDSAGFTLIEVMLVVIIIGILAGAVVVAVRGRSQEAAINTTRITIKSIGSAINLFEVDNGVYPNSLDELVNDTGHPTWRGPYVDGGLNDAWGNKLTYSKTDRGVKLVSHGPDQAAGGDDDITN